jgi:PDZ domain-containing secreted protein
MYEYIFLNEVWNGVKYMYTKRTPVSCGCTQLHDLYPINKASLEAMLRSVYKNWGDRTRPAATDAMGAYERETIENRRRAGEFDNKIYAGETVFFSDADSNGNGKKLVNYIKRHKLGEVVSISARNPNTKNKITSYLWVYNGAKLKEGVRLNGAK